jgi:hypothetical protein
VYGFAEFLGNDAGQIVMAFQVQDDQIRRVVTDQFQALPRAARFQNLGTLAFQRGTQDSTRFRRVVDD